MLTVLPPKASQMLKHHLLPATQQVIRHLNRDAGKDDHGRDR
jgi:hypothetical protein